MDEEKKTKVQTAAIFAGCVLCKCGEKMELHERDIRLDMVTEFYFICPACRQWTGVERIHTNLPIADIMERIQMMERRVMPIRKGTEHGNQQEGV